MKTCGGAGAVREWSGDNFDGVRREQGAHLLDASGVGAVSVTDEESFGVEPENVSGLGGAGRGDRAQGGDFERLAERGVVGAFWNAVRFAGTHDDQTVVGGKTGVVGVNGVEGEIGGGREFEDFGSGRT